MSHALLENARAPASDLNQPILRCGDPQTSSSDAMVRGSSTANGSLNTTDSETGLSTTAATRLAARALPCSISDIRRTADDPVGMADTRAHPAVGTAHAAADCVILPTRSFANTVQLVCQLVYASARTSMLRRTHTSKCRRVAGNKAAETPPHGACTWRLQAWSLL